MCAWKTSQEAQLLRGLASDCFDAVSLAHVSMWFFIAADLSRARPSPSASSTCRDEIYPQRHHWPAQCCRSPTSHVPMRDVPLTGDILCGTRSPCARDRDVGHARMQACLRKASPETRDEADPGPLSRGKIDGPEAVGGLRGRVIACWLLDEASTRRHVPVRRKEEGAACQIDASKPHLHPVYSLAGLTSTHVDAPRAGSDRPQQPAALQCFHPTLPVAACCVRWRPSHFP